MEHVSRWYSGVSPRTDMNWELTPLLLYKCRAQSTPVSHGQCPYWSYQAAMARGGQSRDHLYIIEYLPRQPLTPTLVVALNSLTLHSLPWTGRKNHGSFNGTECLSINFWLGMCFPISLENLVSWQTFLCPSSQHICEVGNYCYFQNLHNDSKTEKLRYAAKCYLVT